MRRRKFRKSKKSRDVFLVLFFGGCFFPSLVGRRHRLENKKGEI